MSSVSRSARHTFSKEVQPEIMLLAGLGVEGDAHAGVTVRHRYMVKKNPGAANLCQVHLLQEELFRELAEEGLSVGAGEMGENITTRGLDLLALGRDTLLHLGESAVVRVTGLRQPCSEMNKLRAGLMKACLTHRDGKVVRKAGIMGVVVQSGLVRAGAAIRIELPEGVPLGLLPV